jgi:hypothetical protein
VQYHAELRHFRYLRIDYNRATVISTISAKKKETGTKQEKLNEQGWCNYIYSYTIGKESQIAPYEGSKPFHMQPSNYNRGLYGGTDNWRVIQWNMRTASNKKTAAAKVRVLNELNPLIGMLNETRRELEIPDYNNLTSLGAPGAH